MPNTKNHAPLPITTYTLTTFVANCTCTWVSAPSLDKAEIEREYGRHLVSHGVERDVSFQ